MGNQSINVAHLPQGIYILEAEIRNQKVIKKLAIK